MKTPCFSGFVPFKHHVYLIFPSLSATFDFPPDKYQPGVGLSAVAQHLRFLAEAAEGQK